MVVNVLHFNLGSSCVGYICKSLVSMLSCVNTVMFSVCGFVLLSEGKL